MLRAFAAVWRWCRAVMCALFVPFHLAAANRRIATMEIDVGDLEALSDDDLKNLVVTEWDRAKTLDDRQQKLTGALSIAVTVGGLAGSTILQDLEASLLRDAAAVLFLMAALLLVVGVHVAFKGLSPKRRYGYGARYLRMVAEGGALARREMVEAAREFERENLMRSNEAAAATASIRNGVLLLALALAASLVAAAGGKDRTDSVAKPPLIPISKDIAASRPGAT